MKRRRFFSALAALPVAPALLSQTQQQPATQTPPQSPGQVPGAPPVEGRGGGGRGGGRGAVNSQIPTFEETALDVVGDTEAGFFTGAQFAALRKLSELLAPPLKGNPGAVECSAPEFLDFLIGASPAERQKLYRTGLDGLNAAAKKKYNKAFADLGSTEADAILRPLLVPVAWTYDPPKDPMQHFIAEAHRDIRTATQNSQQWAAAGASSGRRGFGGGARPYLKPIDPIYRS